MSLGVRCVGFTSEGTGFTVKGGGEFALDVCRGILEGLMKETAINNFLRLSYLFLVLKCIVACAFLRLSYLFLVLKCIVVCAFLRLSYLFLVLKCIVVCAFLRLSCLFLVLKCIVVFGSEDATDSLQESFRLSS